MRVSSVRAIMQSSRGQGSADAFWLARREMSKAWPSYVLGASIVSFMGSVAAVSLSWGVTEFEAAVLPNHRGKSSTAPSSPTTSSCWFAPYSARTLSSSGTTRKTGATPSRRGFRSWATCRSRREH